MSSRSFLAAAWMATALLCFRAGAATVTWDGGGDGVRWNDPLNWTGNTLPGGSDEAVLNPGPEVRLDGAVASVQRATVRRPLRVVSGGLTTSQGLFVSGTSLLLEGGSVQGAVQLSASSLVLSEGATADNPIELRGASVLEGNVPAGMALTVLGSSSGGNARTVWRNGGTNRGVIRLDSINAG